MWPKIHSNRDPRDTLLTELRKEFGAYYQLAGDWGIGLLRSHSKIAFYAMIALLLVSLVLSFTVFRHREKVALLTPVQVTTISDGFGQIMQTTGKIREIVVLKQQVDSLSAKKNLSAADSSRLIAALDRLQQLSKH
ncbi:hypothetical protein [Mucilaginibacter sp. PAMB04168]|uniref:hypothetical protein n=1 Tax=Mucilaginibacter sp. PAMB04168 TaxID=3138567 RepID=UPI0031F67100